MGSLPTNIDTTYPDDAGDPSRKLHQEHHDELHLGHNLNETHRGAGAPHAGHQAASDNLTELAGLDPSAAGVIASDGAGWLRKTYAAIKVSLGLTKADVGLGNVENLTPANMPVSTAQAAADTVVANAAAVALATEATARGGADTALDGRLDTLEVALPAEATARTAGDNALDGRLDTVEAALPNKADLAGGKILTSQIPAIALTTFLGNVGSEAEMLALVGEPGDWATRTDIPAIALVSATPSSTLGNWQLYTFGATGSGVTSVNGDAGPIVVLGKEDLGLANVANLAPVDYPLSTEQAAALDAAVATLAAVDTVLDAANDALDTRVDAVETALPNKVNGDFSFFQGDGPPLPGSGAPRDVYLDRTGIPDESVALEPLYDWRQWGTIAELDGALLEQAVGDVLDDTPHGAQLTLPPGDFGLDRFVQTVGLEGSRAGKRVDFRGAGIGNTVFHAETVDAIIADNEPFYDGTVGAGTTTTHIVAATGTFKQTAVGRQLVALVSGNSVDRDITAVAPDGSWVDVSPGYAFAPTVGDPWAVAAGTVARGHYFGHFTIDCENLADYGLYLGLGAEKFAQYIRVLNPMRAGTLWEGTQNAGTKMIEVIGSHGFNHEFARGVGNLWLDGTMASTGGLGSIWVHQGGLTTQQSVPDKITFFGGLAEEARATAEMAYIATILIEAGNRIAFRGYSVNNAGSSLYPGGTTAAIMLRKEAIYGGPIKVLWDGGQIDAKVGPAVILSGAGAGGGVTELHIAGSPNMKGTPTAGKPYIGWLDDSVEVQINHTSQKLNDLPNRGGPLAGGTATRSFGDVVRFGSTRVVKPTADYPRSSVAPDDGTTFTVVPGLHLERIGQNSTGELEVRLVVDGLATGNIRVRLAAINGVTFVGTMTGIPVTFTDEGVAVASSDEWHPNNAKPVAMGEDRSFRTLGVGTKTIVVIKGELIGPASGSGYGQVNVEVRQNNSQATPTTVYRLGSSMTLRDSGVS